MNKFIAIILLSITLISCEKDIDFATNQIGDVLVVDGTIEDTQEPRIILTHSLNYFAATNLQVAANSFIHNATVTLSNGTITSTLKEYEIPLGAGYSLFYYSNDNTTPTNKIIGEQAKKYDLKIIVNGKEYSASTNIPVLAKKCDSLWWRKDNNIKDCDSCVIMTGRITDPPALGNYIRYFTKVNSEPFFPGEKSAYDDQVVNGITYNIDIGKSLDRNKVDDKNFKYPYPTSFVRGDTVTLKFCNTDKATFTFWNTWEFAYQGIGNPFSTPNKVIGNISNGALGAFCGYSVDYKKLIIAK